MTAHRNGGRAIRVPDVETQRCEVAANLPIVARKHTEPTGHATSTCVAGGPMARAGEER